MIDCPKRSASDLSSSSSQVHEIAEPVGYGSNFGYYGMEEDEPEGEINAFRR